MSQKMCVDVVKSDSFKRALGINDTVVNDENAIVMQNLDEDPEVLLKMSP
uniref:Uncharacterized protein n=1 Tax=uncultured organism MedDCM-OCT-S01-C7 TaxID=743602 RepID=D6PJ00_9ZZZZ|nr:hypothetical protein [uncultured organism MedDCM-OCT-S01-C7]